MSHQIKKHLGAIVRHNGVEFRVWAPFAKNVKLLTPYLGVFDGSNTYDMLSENDGYWSVFVKDAEIGQNYKFLIDTGNELLTKNDPRGRALTASDNGVSVVVGSDFDWGDDLFMPIPKEQQIIYELHIGTFNRRDPATTGTFYDAIEKLDYLLDLGINMIEVMPVTSMAYSNGWGYNVTDVFSIENAYGGRHGLMEFVKACHARGIGVIIDVVYNHFMSGDLWRFDGWYENDRGGIYFYNDWRGDTPWGARPDYGRAEVRQFLIDSIVMWFNEYRVDGLRLDSTAYMRNTLGYNDDPAHDVDGAWSLMQDITDVAHRIRPGSIVIAEDTSGNDYITKQRQDGGCGFDAQWGIPFPHAIRKMLGLGTSWPDDLGEQLLRAYNGDVFQRVIFSDSHDTAANGSTRITSAISPENPNSTRVRQDTIIASAITLTSPGIPMLLQGQEFLQEGAFTDWQVLEWEKTEQFAGIVKAHQDIIDLRKNTYGNTSGLLGQSVRVFHRNDQGQVFGYHRWSQGGPGDDVLVLINFSDTEYHEYHLGFPRPGEWRIRFNSSWQGYNSDFPELTPDSVSTDDSCNLAMDIPARSVLILSQDATAS
ncbi:MAG: alpha-amylase family glycosyl hydrolase [Candidatus Saccharimonas aalborgensis]